MKNKIIENIIFLSKILKENSIDFKIIENGEFKSIIAKINGKDKNLKPVLLLHHFDCVNKSEGLKIINGNFFSPCLLDDKSLGLAHLISFIFLKNKSIKRGVYFVAVPDEEKGGKNGIGYLLEKRLIPEVSFALGEGGRSSCAVDRKLFSIISTSEKGAIWLELKIDLNEKHSAGGGDEILKEILKKIYEIPRFLPFYGKLNDLQNFLLWYKDVFPSKRKIPLNYEEVEAPFQIFTNTTVTLTSIETDGGPNKTPSFLKFKLDIRTADKENHKKFFKWIKNKFPEANLNILLEVFPSSNINDKEYLNKILNALKKIIPSLKCGPGICPGFSDLRYLREKGIPSFGFSPFFLNYYHEASIHSKKEYMPEERFLEGIEIMKKFLEKICEN